MRHHRHYGRLSMQIVLIFFLVCSLVLWGWNSAIPDLFGLPALQFKQALGLTILLFIVSFLVGSGRSPGVRHWNRGVKPSTEKAS